MSDAYPLTGSIWRLFRCRLQRHRSWRQDHHELGEGATGRLRLHRERDGRVQILL